MERRPESLPRPARQLALAAALAAAAMPIAAGAAPAQAAATPTTAAAPTPADRDRWADSARRAIEAAATRADRAALAIARALLDRALAAHPNDPLLLHYQGYALWREASLVLGGDRPRDARPLLQAADRVLERSAERLPLPETFALRGSVTGQLIGTSRNPLDAMRLGPRSTSLLDRAAEVGADNPRVWLVRGMNAIHTPGMFGGGLDRAEAHLQRAITLFAADRPAPPLPAWGEADAHLWLGQVHAKQGRREQARASYERALALQPGHAWVLRELLPAVM